MIPSIISLAISPYTPQGVYCEIYPSLGGNIERVKSQYSLFQNGILLREGLQKSCIRTTLCHLTCGLISSSCGGLWPRLLFSLWAKKSFYSVCAYLKTILVFSSKIRKVFSNLSNFEKNPKISPKKFLFKNLKKSNKIKKIQKKPKKF